MKNVIILHGTSETPNDFWYPWIKQKIENKKYTVSIPELPDTDHPRLHNWLPAALKQNYTPETILIGHSSGASLILSVLENLTTPIKQAILVAGFATHIKAKEANHILQQTYNWKKIAAQAEDILLINSDNDPWGCDDTQGISILNHFEKGTLIIPKTQGHMGSNTFNQPYTEFPLLLKLIG